MIFSLTLVVVVTYTAIRAYYRAILLMRRTDALIRDLVSLDSELKRVNNRLDLLHRELAELAAIKRSPAEDLPNDVGPE